MRIVSLCPSVTETVFALGRGGDLVGRSKFCIHPDEAVKHVPRVGGTKNPKIDAIVALEPDIVLMNDEENRKEDADALKAAGLQVFSTCPRSVAGAAASVRAFGEVLEARREAAALADEIEAAAGLVPADSVSFAYLIWREPFMTINGDTYISDLLASAGGRNVFAASPSRYPEVSADELVAAAPELVLLSSEPFPFVDKHRAELPFPADQVLCCDGERLSWHGARTPAGLAYARELLRAR